MEFFENLFIIGLKAFGTPEKMKYVLDNNITMLEYFRNHKNFPLLVLGYKLLSYNQKEKINIDNTLRHIRETNYDIFKVLVSHPNGKKWLEKQFNFDRYKEFL